jgi:hypothetical protein
MAAIQAAMVPNGKLGVLALASRLHDQVEKFFRFLRIIAPQLLGRFHGGAAIA